jgi:hypothetical protein
MPDTGKERNKFIVDLNILNSHNATGCGACGGKFNLGETVVMAYGGWQGGAAGSSTKKKRYTIQNVTPITSGNSTKTFTGRMDDFRFKVTHRDDYFDVWNMLFFRHGCPCRGTGDSACGRIFPTKT